MHISVGSSSLGPFLFEGANMAEWKLFPLDVPRPEPTGELNESRRKFLEYAIATTVSSLLANYGEVESSDVDNVGNPDENAPVEYNYISLEEHLLADDEDKPSTLTIGQLPWVKDGIITQKGVHSVYKESFEGSPEPAYLVYDPAIDTTTPRVSRTNNSKVALEELAELADALQIIFAVIDENEDEEPNQPPLQPQHYPLPIDETFQALVEGISFDTGE